MAVRIAGRVVNKQVLANPWFSAAFALVVASAIVFLIHPVSFLMGDYSVEIGVKALPADLSYYGILDQDAREIPNFSLETHVRAVQLGRWRCGAVTVKVRNTQTRGCNG